MPSAALASRYEALFRDSLAELELLVKKEEEQEEEGEEDVDEAKEEEKEEDLGAEEGDEEEEEDDQRAQRAEASRRRFESARGPLEKATVAIAELRRAVEGKKKSGLFFVAPGESGGDAASAVAAELAALLSAAYAYAALASSSPSSSSFLPPLPLVAERVLPWAPPEIAASIALNADGGALAVVAAALARAASSPTPSPSSGPSSSSGQPQSALKLVAAASPSAADAVLEACLSVRACPLASGALEIAAAGGGGGGGGGGGARAAALARAATVRAAAFLETSAAAASSSSPSSSSPAAAAAWLAAALSSKTPESDAFVAALEADALSRGRGRGGRSGKALWSRDDDAGVAASARLLAAGAPPASLNELGTTRGRRSCSTRVRSVSGRCQPSRLATSPRSGQHSTPGGSPPSWSHSIVTCRSTSEAGAEPGLLLS